MSLFRYNALNEQGKKQQGIIDAESLMDAKQKLVRRQVFVTKVALIEEKQSGNRLKKKDVLMLTRELSRLLQAGLPLYESLAILEEKYQHQAPHELLLDLCDQIRAGQPFSKALERHPSCFDVLYCSMIANAERGGHLSKSLNEIVRLLEKQQQVQGSIVGALLYPALLSSFCLVVLCVLLFFVVPSLFDLFEGREVHPFTQFVFAASRFAIHAKWGLLSLVLALMGWGAWVMFSLQGRAQIRKIFLRLPFIRDLLAKVALSRFFRSTATLIEGGLPALFALQQASRSLCHPPLESSIQMALERLSQGESLQKALQGLPYIPSLVPRMLGIAQEGGNLSSMMHQIASIYEEDLEKALASITTFAQPILLLLLGGMVGFVLLSVLLPLTDVSTFST